MASRNDLVLSNIPSFALSSCCFSSDVTKSTLLIRELAIFSNSVDFAIYSLYFVVNSCFRLGER